MSARFLAGTLLLFGVMLFEDIHFFRKPRENWAAAAQQLQQEINRGSCIIFVPESSSEIYKFVNPELDLHRCKPELHQPSIIVALSPYDSKPAWKDVQQQLSNSGHNLVSKQDLGGPQLFLYHRR